MAIGKRTRETYEIRWHFGFSDEDSRGGVIKDLVKMLKKENFQRISSFSNTKFKRNIDGSMNKIEVLLLKRKASNADRYGTQRLYVKAHGRDSRNLHSFRTRMDQFANGHEDSFFEYYGSQHE